MGTIAHIESILVIIFLGLAFAILWVFYFFFYWQYRVDKTRQALFFLRNDLFDYALEGNISFDHPAYGLLRNAMNSMIRFTHRIELFTLLCLYIAKKSSPTPYNDFMTVFKNRLDSLKSEEVKEKLIEFQIRMNIIIAAHLIKSSIFLMLLTIFFGAFILVHQEWKNLKYEVLFRQGWEKLKYKIKKQFPMINQVENIAYELG